MASSYTATDAHAYEHLMGRWSSRLAEELIAFAGIEAGDRVLDDRRGGQAKAAKEPHCHLVAAVLLGTRTAASAAEIVVFAAASLKEALDDAVRVYDNQSGDAVKISYAASPALAKQIESGAPADLFISADLDWMDYLQLHKLIQPQTRKNLLGNRLVIVAPADSDLKLDIKPGFDLAGALKGGHLAMANPDSVPAGKYGKAALE